MESRGGEGAHAVDDAFGRVLMPWSIESAGPRRARARGPGGGALTTQLLIRIRSVDRARAGGAGAPEGPGGADGPCVMDARWTRAAAEYATEADALGTTRIGYGNALLTSPTPTTRSTRARRSPRSRRRNGEPQGVHGPRDRRAGDRRPPRDVPAADAAAAACSRRARRRCPSSDPFEPSRRRPSRGPRELLEMLAPTTPSSS